MFPKPKRIVDQELLNKYRGSKCVVCGDKSDPCHIRTIKSGGDDVDYNLISLCRRHHQEQHTLGFAKLCNRYSMVYDELMKKGWIFNNNKLVRK